MGHSLTLIIISQRIMLETKYKMVRASDEEMEEYKDFINPNEPLYFIEKVLD